MLHQKQQRRAQKQTGDDRAYCRPDISWFDWTLLERHSRYATDVGAGSMAAEPTPEKVLAEVAALCSLRVELLSRARVDEARGGSTVRRRLERPLALPLPHAAKLARPFLLHGCSTPIGNRLSIRIAACPSDSLSSAGSNLRAQLPTITCPWDAHLRERGKPLWLQLQPHWLSFSIRLLRSRNRHRHHCSRQRGASLLHLARQLLACCYLLVTKNGLLLLQRIPFRKISTIEEFIEHMFLSADQYPSPTNRQAFVEHALTDHGRCLQGNQH